VAAAWIGVKRGIRMPKIMIDEFLFMVIVAGMGLTVAYLRAECVLHRRFNAAEREKLSVQHELHANRLRAKQIDEPVVTLRNHRHFISQESALCVDLNAGQMASYRIFEKSAEEGTARHRELA